MFYGQELFGEALPILIRFIPVTLFYFLVPTGISLLLGAWICKVRVGKKGILYRIVSLFVSFFRGTPGLLQLYLVFFGLPQIAALFGADIYRWHPGFFYIVATCLNFSSFVSEAYRGAYEAIDTGQVEAGIAIGFNRFQNFIYVIAPLTLKTALPNLKNLEIDLLKGTATAYVIGVVDVMGRADKLVALHRGYGQLWILSAAGLIYLGINIIVEIFFRQTEKSLRISERGIHAS